MNASLASPCCAAQHTHQALEDGVNMIAIPEMQLGSHIGNECGGGCGCRALIIIENIIVISENITTILMIVEVDGRHQLYMCMSTPPHILLEKFPTGPLKLSLYINTAQNFISREFIISLVCIKYLMHVLNNL